MPDKPHHPNFLLLLAVAQRMGANLLEQCTFIGGSVLPAYASANASDVSPAYQCRISEDVDLVTPCAALKEWHRAERLFRERGFAPEGGASDSPICRMRTADDLAIDLLPSNPSLLGFRHSRWLPSAVKHVQMLHLEEGVSVKYPQPAWSWPSRLMPGLTGEGETC